MAEITLTAPQEVPKITLTNPQGMVKAPAMVEDRAERASYATGAPYEETLSNLQNGYEPAVREQASTKDALEKEQARIQNASDIARQAAAEGRPLSFEEQESIQAPAGAPIDPSVVLEDLYSKRFINSLDDYPDWTSFEEAFAEDPKAAVAIRDGATNIATRREIVLNMLQEQSQKVSEQPWLNTGYDFVRGMVPFMSQWQQSNKIGDGGDFLLGRNIRDQRVSLFALRDPVAFKAELQKAVDDISADNNLEAVSFLQKMYEYSSTDEMWDSVFTGLDVADVASLGLGKAVLSLGKTALYGKRAKAAAQGTAAAMSVEPLAADIVNSPVIRRVLSGDIAGASENIAAHRMAAAGVGGAKGTPVANVMEAMKAVPSFLDPTSYTRNAGSLGLAGAAELLEALTHQRRLLISTADDFSHIERLSPEGSDVAMDLAKQDLLRQNPRIENQVVDIRRINAAGESFGGVDRVEAIVGGKGATGFSTPNQAEFHAKHMFGFPEGGYEIVEESGNFFVKVQKTVDETDPRLGEWRIKTTNAAPVTWLRAFIGGLGTPDGLIGKHHNQIRKVATYGANGVMQRLAESAKALNGLGKEARGRLRDIMVDAQNKYRTVIDTDGKPKQVQGMYYKDIAELEQAYVAKGFSIPTLKETQAYFEFVQIMDWDLVQRNVSMVRDLSRQGVDQVSVSLGVPNGQGLLTYKSLPFFNGREVESLPSRSGTPYTVAFVDAKTGHLGFGVSNKLEGWELKKIDELLASGDYKIVQPADANDPALQGLVRPRGKGKDLRLESLTKGEAVEYIIVKDVKHKPLAPDQIPRNEGGHANYDNAAVFVKQGQSHRTGSGRRVLTGDVTAFQFTSPRQAQIITQGLETARKMLKEALAGNGDLRAFNAFVDKNLPYTGAQLVKKFKGAVGAEADAPFNLDAPFVVTQGGQRSWDITNPKDVFGEEVVDRSLSEHNLSNKVSSQYAAQRSDRLLTVDNLGNEANPVYKLQQSDLIDPLEGLSRNVVQMAQNRYLEDYKLAAIEDWGSQFADTLGISTAEFRADPLGSLRRGEFKKDYLDTIKMAAAKNGRSAILSLLGVHGQDEQLVRWAKQRLADSLYSSSGSKGVKLVDPWLWDAKTDPTTIVRSMPFQAFFGFNPLQLFLQGSTAAMAMAIDGNPIRSAQSIFGYLYMRSRMLAKESPRASGMISKAFEKALGLNDGVLEDMYEAYQRSGVNIIAGENARIDDWLNPRMFYQSGVPKALDAGLVFFREGNRIHSGTAFALAYLKHSAENGGKRLTNRELTQVTERANLLGLRMTRDSNAAWQGGKEWWQKAASVPTQFFAFQHRLTELMLGRQLTWDAKTRLVAVNSLLWGVPAGTAGTALGVVWPFSESIRQAAVENGMDMDDDTNKLLMEGVVSMGVEQLTGTNYDIEGRLGPGGLSWARDLLDGNTFEVLGAGPNFLSNMFQQSSPFAKALVDTFSGKSNQPILQDTFLSVLRLSSQTNNLVKAMQVYNTGEYLKSNNIDTVMSIDPGDMQAALAQAVGLTPQEVTDTYLKLRSNTQFAEAKAAVSKEVLEWTRKGLIAASQGETELADAYLKNAQAIGITAGLTPIEQGELFKRGMSINKDLIDQVDEDFFRNVPSRVGEYRNMFTDPTPIGGN